MAIACGCSCGNSQKQIPAYTPLEEKKSVTKRLHAARATMSRAAQYDQHGALGHFCPSAFVCLPRHAMRQNWYNDVSNWFSVKSDALGTGLYTAGAVSTNVTLCHSHCRTRDCSIFREVLQSFLQQCGAPETLPILSGNEECASLQIGL